jgi:hypothetical protein
MSTSAQEQPAQQLINQGRLTKVLPFSRFSRASASPRADSNAVSKLGDACGVLAKPFS